MTIEAAGPLVETASTAVAPLLVPDVPVFLWWKDIPHYDDKLFNRLSEMADRVVIDSASFDQPHQDLLRLAEILKSGKLHLSDIKVGAWYHTGEFPDQRRDSSGLSLADPASNGMPARHGSNFGAYLVMNKMVWRRPDTATQGLAAFLRLGYAPPDRNLFSFEVDAGLTFKGLFPNRELDVLGVGAAFGRIGYARRLDRDQVLFTGTGGTIRDYEAVLELTAKRQSWGPLAGGRAARCRSWGPGWRGGRLLATPVRWVNLRATVTH